MGARQQVRHVRRIRFGLASATLLCVLAGSACVAPPPPPPPPLGADCDTDVLFPGADLTGSICREPISPTAT